MKIAPTRNNSTYGSKKKKSNKHRKMCPEFRRLRKIARQFWKKFVDAATRNEFTR